MKYELCIYPPALFEKSFVLRTTNKFTFAIHSQTITNNVKMQLTTFHATPRQIMMTSSNGNIFRVTGPLGEFTGHRWIPRTKASDADLCFFSLICAWINGCVNNHEAGDLICHRAHYDVIVMGQACHRWGEHWRIELAGRRERLVHSLCTSVHSLCTSTNISQFKIYAQLWYRLWWLQQSIYKMQHSSAEILGDTSRCIINVIPRGREFRSTLQIKFHPSSYCHVTARLLRGPRRPGCWPNNNIISSDHCQRRKSYCCWERYGHHCTPFVSFPRKSWGCIFQAWA